MKVKNVIFCRNSSVDAFKGLSAEAIFNILTFRTLPVSMDFSMLFFLNDFDKAVSSDVSIRLISPEGVVADSVQGHIDYHYVEGLEDRFQGMNIETKWNNVVFFQEGVYKVQLFVEDDLVGEDAFLVLKKEG